MYTDVFTAFWSFPSYLDHYLKKRVIFKRCGLDKVIHWFRLADLYKKKKINKIIGVFKSRINTVYQGMNYFNVNSFGCPFIYE